MRKKGLWSIAVAACTGVCLTAAPVFAAGEYTVTIRPGNVARFTEEFLQEYMALGAQVTEKTGSIKVKVAAGETIPMLPTPPGSGIRGRISGPLCNEYRLVSPG